jgi:hypothetical protein
MYPTNLTETVRLTSLLTGISLLIGCTEEISRLSNFRPNGLFSWNVFSTQLREANRPLLRSFLAILFGYRGVRLLCFFQLFACVCLAVPITPIRFLLAPAMVALGVRLALNFRCSYGTDGSDQVETMLLVGLISTLLLWPSPAAAIGMWFVTGQSTLAYFTSGVSKVFSPAWRSGEAAFKIFNTYTYGSVMVAGFFRDLPSAAAPACIAMVGWETIFPVILIAPLSISLSLLGIGVLFHAFNAFVMGLNKFFWAFVATYPAILYCHGQLTTLLGNR